MLILLLIVGYISTGKQLICKTNWKFENDFAVQNSPAKWLIYVLFFFIKLQFYENFLEVLHKLIDTN